MLKYVLIYIVALVVLNRLKKSQWITFNQLWKLLKALKDGIFTALGFLYRGMLYKPSVNNAIKEKANEKTHKEGHEFDHAVYYRDGWVEWYCSCGEKITEFEDSRP